jgi:hypothetical protein
MASFDPEMLQLTQKGDRKAQQQFYREAFPVLMGVCMRYHDQYPDRRIQAREKLAGTHRFVRDPRK